LFLDEVKIPNAAIRINDYIETMPIQSTNLMQKLAPAFWAQFFYVASKTNADLITKEDLLLPNLLANCC